jgi:cytochrome c oxidase subunit III
MQGSISDQTQINIAAESAHDSHHEAHPDHRIFGLLVFLVAEGMIFLGLFIAYLAFRAMAPEARIDVASSEYLRADCE